MKKATLALLVAVLAGCSVPRAELPTASNIDLDRYAGTWYEQARLPNRFQKKCVSDVRAEYEIQTENTIRVTNQCLAADGSTKIARGEGRLSAALGRQDPAKLEVRFAPEWLSWLPAVWGDYWILKLEGNYQYSLVGTPNLEYLWVLSREKEADPELVQNLLNYAKTLGFPIADVE